LDVRRSSAEWDFDSYGRFDLVTLTDVIEHVEDEQRAIAAVRRVLKPAGVLLVTTPALMSLWSGHDLINHHYRRYTRGTLMQLFPPSDWEILKVSYFSSFLLPMIWTARKLSNLREGVGPAAAHSDIKFGPRWLDGTLQAIMTAELPFLRRASLPLGSSLILVGRPKA
jgi:SAM-dependent methyltransferase